MDTTVTKLGDVLGPPETWPNFSRFRDFTRRDMQGAVISAVETRDAEIVVSTQGGISGPTYSVFRVADPDLRERAMRVLRLGLEVHSAVDLAI
jgi:hypothetical protein